MKRRSSKYSKLRLAFEKKQFPFTDLGAPLYIKCTDCGGNGWGPMLTDSVWKSLRLQDTREFICETCMEIRLGRRLVPTDLEDCAMNCFHRLFTGSVPKATHF